MSTATPDIRAVLARLAQSYVAYTPTRERLIDLYLGFAVLMGVLQFVYCALVGTFPFHSFLGGFIAAVGTFVLTGACAALPACGAARPRNAAVAGPQ